MARHANNPENPRENPRGRPETGQNVGDANAQQEGANLNPEDEEILNEIDRSFALTPALSTKETLDYKGMVDSKIYKNGSAKLSVEIDGTPENLNLVLDAIEEKAVSTGWLDTVLKIHLENGEHMDLLTQYGQLTMEQVKHHVGTYIDKNVRAAQDSMMMYSCLSNSMTQEARKKILLYKNEYYFNDRIPSGALLLKVLIRESYVDTNATIKFVRENLSSLDVYMVKVDSDIEKFNQYVYQNLLKLKSHGQTTSDLMANLFKGYAKASDKVFVAYIAKKEDDYDEGRDCGHVQLMLLALQKYKTLTEAGKWNAPTDAEAKIIALEAEVTKLKAKNNGHTNKYNNKSKNSYKNTDNSGKDHGKSPGTKQPPEWMTTKPKEGESHTKMVSGKEYHWCNNHQAWTRHKPSECKGKGYKFPSKKSDDTEKKRKPDDNSKDKNDKKKPKLVALTSMYESSDEE